MIWRLYEAVYHYSFDLIMLFFLSLFLRTSNYTCTTVPCILLHLKVPWPNSVQSLGQLGCWGGDGRVGGT